MNEYEKFVSGVRPFTQKKLREMKYQIQTPLATEMQGDNVNSSSCCGCVEGDGDIYTDVRKLKSEMEELIKWKNDKNPVIDFLSKAMGNIEQMQSGTVGRTIPANNNEIQLFTRTQVNNMLGVTDSSVLNTTILVMNGDDVPLNHTIVSATYRGPNSPMHLPYGTEPDWIVLLSERVPTTRLVRFNYLILRWK